MTSKQTIVNLADDKLKEAVFLYENGFYDSAYYLGGYVIELLLKARICDLLGIDDFFEPVSAKYLEKEALRPFKVHDFTQLLVFSGIFSKLKDKFIEDNDIKRAWTYTLEWNESCRYSTGKEKKVAESFLSSVKIIEKWIKNYL